MRQNGKSKKRIQKLFINLVFLLSVFLILFSIAEISARLFYDESVNYERVVWERLQRMSSLSQKTRSNYYVNSNNGLVYNIDDDTLYEGQYTQFNPGIRKEKNKEDYRIIVLGDSFTMGGGLENFNLEDRYTTQLYKILNNEEKIKAENNIDKFEVLPFTDGGLNTYQELLLLKNIALFYNPDLVILQYTDNDIGLPRSELGSNEMGIYISSITNLLFIDNKIVPMLPYLNERISKLLLKKSAFLRFISYKLNIISLNASNNAEEWHNLSFNSIMEMSEILKENNIPFIIINLPPASFTEEYRCGRLKDNYRAESFHNELKEFIARLNVPFFNICDYVDDIHSIKSEIEPKDYDQSHYNKEGYCMAAEILKEAILDEIIEKD